MSEYQYYEFRAIDRPLDAAAREALRSISTRARITATSFTNHYEWGDFKGDPGSLMERWFDLHLYLANWGTRRLMMRLPRRLVARSDLDPFLADAEEVDVWDSGDDLIVDIHRESEEPDDDWDDGSGWLAALVPLRAALLSGDLRLFYLLWLSAVQEESMVPDDAIEPLPGIGPLDEALEAFADFFAIDGDLVQAAAEAGDAEPFENAVNDALAALSESDKATLLRRLVEGDAHVAAEIRSQMRRRRPPAAAPRRTAGALRARQLEEARERAVARRRDAERRRREQEVEKARRQRIAALKQRGEGVWREIESGIERRSPSSYDRAASLIFDLRDLAREEGLESDFRQRIASLRLRHENKWRFMERLDGLGDETGE